MPAVKSDSTPPKDPVFANKKSKIDSETKTKSEVENHMPVRSESKSLSFPKLNFLNSSSSKVNANINFPEIEMLFTALAFLVPFFFLPFTTDLVNINKSYLIILISTVALLVLLLKSLKNGALSIHKFGLHAPILMLLVPAILAAYFSFNRNISIWGQFGSYNNSLIFITSLCLIYVVGLNSKIHLSKILTAFTAGVLISTLFGWLSFYGTTLPYFGRLGYGATLADSFYSLMGMQIVCITYCLYRLFGYTHDMNQQMKVFYSFSLFIFTSFVIISLYWPALILLLLVVLYLFSFGDLTFVRRRNLLGLIVGMAAFVSLFHIIPLTAGLMNFTRMEVPRLGLWLSWIVSVASALGKPLWGTGLNLFEYSYLQYRPPEINSTPYWEATFAQPFNDLFLWFSTAGGIGLLGFIGFIVLMIARARYAKLHEDQSEYADLLIVSIAALLVLGFSTGIYVLLFLPGLLIFTRSKTI